MQPIARAIVVAGFASFALECGMATAQLGEMGGGNAAGFGAGPIGGMGGAIGHGMIVPVGSDGQTPPPFLPVTEELRDARDRRPAAGKESDTAKPTAEDGNSRDALVKRQGYVRIRTTRYHPQPNLRHASAAYEAFEPMLSASGHIIRQALQRPLPLPVRFSETPLRDVISRLASDSKITIIPDTPALTDAGLDIDKTTVTAAFEGISLRSALRLSLRDSGLTYLIKDEVLLITTADKAKENLIVRLYPAPSAAEIPMLVDLIQSSVAVDSWDITGGNGAVTPFIDKSVLVISQVEEVHEEIEVFLAAVIDGDGSQAASGTPADPAAIPTRLYTVRDENVLPELEQKLVALCNSALGAAGDPEAKVNVLGSRLVVQSRKRSFHVYAAEMIQAINGVDVLTPEYFGVSGEADVSKVNSGMGGGFTTGGGMGIGGNAFPCWVAREVYGQNDPRWLSFRDWMFTRAPRWLRDAYAAHGEAFAGWLRDKPLAKAAIRFFMDFVVTDFAAPVAP